LKPVFDDRNYLNPDIENPTLSARTGLMRCSTASLFYRLVGTAEQRPGAVSGLNNNAAFEMCGIICRGRLAANRLPIGSTTATNTIGIDRVC
jgi:hypothetical protein